MFVVLVATIRRISHSSICVKNGKLKFWRSYGIRLSKRAHIRMCELTSKVTNWPQSIMGCLQRGLNCSSATSWHVYSVLTINLGRKYNQMPHHCHPLKDSQVTGVVKTACGGVKCPKPQKQLSHLMWRFSTIGVVLVVHRKPSNVCLAFNNSRLLNKR